MKKDYIVLYRQISTDIFLLVTIIGGFATGNWTPFWITLLLFLLSYYSQQDLYRFSDREIT